MNSPARFGLIACACVLAAGSAQSDQPLSGDYVGSTGDGAYLLHLEGAAATGRIDRIWLDRQGRLTQRSARLVILTDGDARDLLIRLDQFAAVPVFLSIQSSGVGLTMKGEGIDATGEVFLAKGGDMAAAVDGLRAKSQQMLTANATSRIESALNPLSAEDVRCGCGEGKMARVAQATHEFAAKVGALDQSTDDLIASVDLHLRELAQIADRYRAVTSKAQGALAAGSSASAIFREYSAAIKGWHETIVALQSAFQQTREPLDKALVELQKACRLRQPVPDAPMSTEMREWSDACQRVDEIGARYHSESERWQSTARGLQEWDRLQWREWKTRVERVADAG